MKAKILAIIPSVIAFIVVFNFFYSLVAFYPFTVADVENFIPRGYVKEDDVPKKILVHGEMLRDLKVIEFWYYWDYDGWKKKDDYEPVIVYVKGERVYALATRIHYNWKVTFNPLIADGNHVLITFLYRWHTPLNVPPPSDYVLIENVPVEITNTPPEELNHEMIIGIPSPLESAFTSALLYGSLSAVVVYVISYFLLRRFIISS